MQILEEDGDWSKDQFWVVVRFLRNSSRSNEILPVFDMWKEKEKSRINEFNYEEIVGLLCKEGKMEEATQALGEMKAHNLTPSSEIYNSIIHGYAKNQNFKEAIGFLSEMKEIDLSPGSRTYDGLIEAYGKYRMYDEIGLCLKRMELDCCSPDQITCNLLIQELSRGGLLQRMESVYQRMRSKRMNLNSSSLVAMLEAYANFGVLDKMEKMYKRVSNSKIILKEDLVRKLSTVYIKNYMFSRLDDLGLHLLSIGVKTDLVWCLRLLSQACILSRKGMDSIVEEMEEGKVPWSVTIGNISLLAYLKMKDFKHTRIILSELSARDVKPDVITISTLFDANKINFDGTATLETWRRRGLLYREVEMKTDPIVLAAFGKGCFLRSFEEAYKTLDPKVTESTRWTYHSLIDFVFRHHGKENFKTL